LPGLPNSLRFEPVKGLTLPDLNWVESPNVSDRRHGITPYLVVMHRPVGSYESALRTLTYKNPDVDKRVSAHVLTEHTRATQLVPWDKKAWTAASFNSVSYNIEADDNAWGYGGNDWDAFYTAAHICAWFCHKTGIPPVWQQDPRYPGVTRHKDLGAAGGGHTDPTSNLIVWRNFIRQVEHDVAHTGWRPSWGRGRLPALDV
jgi:N-acetylmuramoyl-L-alanine amidase